MKLGKICILGGKQNMALNGFGICPEWGGGYMQIASDEEVIMNKITGGWGDLMLSSFAAGGGKSLTQQESLFGPTRLFSPNHMNLLSI